MARYLFNKVLLAGATDSGTDALLRLPPVGSFDKSTLATIGTSFAVANLQLAGVGEVTLEWWLLGGGERFRMMLPSYCDHAQGALVLFSLADPRSLTEAKEWVATIQANTNNVPMILASDSCDIAEPDHPRKITAEVISDLVETRRLKEYVEISTATGEGVQEMYAKLAQYLVDDWKLHNS
ncbi:MAG TPA: ADP-ribosylation factor-like protein [Candidatus Lokiarchaeia archaeon]|nr:ADP-ribosylation factor-like protein [Candidatus Lokiarchaeia archaeon]